MSMLKGSRAFSRRSMLFATLKQELEVSNNPTAPLPDQLYHWHRVRSSMTA